MRSRTRSLSVCVVLAFLSRPGFGEEAKEDLKKRFHDVAEWHARIVVVIRGEGSTSDGDYFRQTFSVVREAEVSFRVKLNDFGVPNAEKLVEMALAMAPEKEKAQLRKQLEEMRNKRDWGAPMRERKPEEFDDVRLSVDDRLFTSGKEACGEPYPYTDSYSVTGRDTRKDEGYHRLEIDIRNGTWDLHVDPKVDLLTLTTTSSHTGGETQKPNLPPKTGPGPATGFPDLIPRSLKLPEEGSVLSGCEQIPRNRLPFNFSYGTVTGTITWTLSPVPLEDVELVLEPEDYEIWRPFPGPDEKTEGNGLPVKAVLRLKGGGNPSRTKMKSLLLSLADVSREPGVCLNWPRDGALKEADLAFLERFNTSAGVTVEGQGARLRKKGGEFLEHGAEISVFDGGAWGTLRAEAVLTDGRFIRGILVGKPGSFDVPLPKRGPDSKIADEWKKDRKAVGLKDGSDDETEPVGDGQRGDGLTLYEEYRGFWVDGEWDGTCDPNRKDLFLHNAIGDKAQSGIWRFRDATELRVHDKLAEEEFKADRVINFNRAQGAHIVDQHILKVREGSIPGLGSASFCRKADHADFPGPPKNTKEVLIYPDHLLDDADKRFDRGGEVYSISWIDATIAHELGHGLGLRHHGETDDFDGKTWKWEKAADGEDKIFEDGVRVFVFNEKTKSLMSGASLFPGGKPGDSMTVWVGEKHGQHGGDEACLMRYDCAKAYRAQADHKTSRWYHGSQEVIGIRLCESPAGTGKNMPTHDPQSRYGGAASGRGKCKFMFVVSDKWEKKSK